MVIGYLYRLISTTRDSRDVVECVRTLSYTRSGGQLEGGGGLFIKYNKTCFDTNGWVKGGANCGYWIQNGGDNRGDVATINATKCSDC